MPPSRRPRRGFFVLLLLAGALAQIGALHTTIRVVSATGPTLPHPLLFVTHVPTSYDVLTTATVFGNQLGDVYAAGRGGDLWLRLSDGTRKNLTILAGLGARTGFPGATPRPLPA